MRTFHNNPYAKLTKYGAELNCEEMHRTTVGSTKLICTEITTNMRAHSIRKWYGRWAGQRKAWWSNKTVIRSQWNVDLCKLASHVLCSPGPLVFCSFVLCHMVFTRSCCVPRGGVSNRMAIEQSWPVLHRHGCGCWCPTQVQVSVSAKKKEQAKCHLKSDTGAWHLTWGKKGTWVSSTPGSSSPESCPPET